MWQSTLRVCPDPLDNGQPDARSFIGFGRVQPLEDAEQLINIAHIESDAVVTN